jgi:hypothetical protein
VLRVYSLSFPTLTEAVVPPLTTLPGPLLDSCAPSSTFTVTVTLPVVPAGTSAIVQVTVPPPVAVAPVHKPPSDEPLYSTLASSVSLITISVAVVL